MTARKWHEDPLVAFDTETTGTNPADARIITAATVHVRPGERPIAQRWIIDPGVDIPDEAAAVHGYTNDRLAQLIGRPDHALRISARGHRSIIPRATAMFEIAAQVASAMAREAAVVIHNAPYDLTLLEAETARNDVAPITTRPYGIRGVVDPMVIEKNYDPYRKTCYKAPGCNAEERHHECGGCRGGKHKCGGCGATDKTLSALCAHYGVVHAGAHDCADDAIATVRLLHKLLAASPAVAKYKLATLHERQVDWRQGQADGLREFFDKVGKPHDGVCGAWPLHTDACAGAHRVEVAA